MFVQKAPPRQVTQHGILEVPNMLEWFKMYGCCKPPWLAEYIEKNQILFSPWMLHQIVKENEALRGYIPSVGRVTKLLVLSHRNYSYLA